jgi:hypothetical protein
VVEVDIVVGVLAIIIVVVEVVDHIGIQRMVLELLVHLE